MEILIYLISIPARVFRRVRVIILKQTLGRLGRGSYLYAGVEISYPRQVFIGEDVSIAPGANLGASSQGSITIGDRCAIAAGTRIVTATHDPRALPVSIVGVNKRVVIGTDVWIGTAAIILPGITIHDGAIIAAGAVVADDVLPDCMVGGVPARLLKKLEPLEVRREVGKQHAKRMLSV